MSENPHLKGDRKTEVFREDEENNSSPFYVPLKCLEITENNKQHIDVDVIIEERFDLFVNNVHITTFFVNPNELRELALGFLVCEGFIEPNIKIHEITIKDKSIFCEIDSILRNWKN